MFELKIMFGFVMLGCCLFTWGHIRFLACRGYYETGMEHLRKNDFRRAIACFEQAEEGMTEVPEFWYNLAVAFVGLGGSAEALWAARRVLSIAPDHVMASQLVATISGETNEK